MGGRFKPYVRGGISPGRWYWDAVCFFFLERRRVTDPYDNHTNGNCGLYGLIHHSIPVDDIRESCGRRKRDP